MKNGIVVLLLLLLSCSNESENNLSENIFKICSNWAGKVDLEIEPDNFLYNSEANSLSFQVIDNFCRDCPLSYLQISTELLINELVNIDGNSIQFDSIDVKYIYSDSNEFTPLQVKNDGMEEIAKLFKVEKYKEAIEYIVYSMDKEVWTLIMQAGDALDDHYDWFEYGDDGLRLILNYTLYYTFNEVDDDGKIRLKKELDHMIDLFEGTSELIALKQLKEVIKVIEG
ncbi:MAG: hypothetical protein AAF806_05060 [Bacteroidota bacterium]